MDILVLMFIGYNLLMIAVNSFMSSLYAYRIDVQEPPHLKYLQIVAKENLSHHGKWFAFWLVVYIIGKAVFWGFPEFIL